MTSKALQSAIDNALVAQENQRVIGKCNMRINPRMKQKDSTYQVVLDALALTTCYPTFLITVKVSVIYMHQFWATVDKQKPSYRFKIDKKRFSMNVEVFNDILNMCQRILGQEFDEPPTEEEALSSIHELGHSREIKYITDVIVDHLHQPWRTFASIFSKCLCGMKPTKAKKDVPSKKKPASKPKPTKKKAPVEADRGKGLNVLSEDNDKDDVKSDANDDNKAKKQEEDVRTLDRFQVNDDDDEEYDELYKDVNVRSKVAEHEEVRKGDAVMPDTTHESASHEKSYEQVIEDAHMTLTSSQKTEGSKQSSSVSSDFASKLITWITKLPQILPKEISDFATPMIQSIINESLENVVLAKSSSQPQLTYEAVGSLIEFELKKILLDKLEKMFETANTEMPQDQGNDLGNAKDQPNVEEASKHYWFKKLERPPTLDLIRVKVMKWYDHGHASSLGSKKLFNLEKDDLFNLNMALWLFARCIVILKRVEDLQLGVKSYQKKLNITRPETFRSDITKMTPYTAYNNPQGIIYQDKFKRNKLMRSDELYKFCDSTLSFVRRVLHDIASSLEMDYLPK
nr:hypothetical protein [Tanacetum cinerariifolium]